MFVVLGMEVEEVKKRVMTRHKGVEGVLDVMMVSLTKICSYYIRHRNRADYFPICRKSTSFVKLLPKMRRML